MAYKTKTEGKIVAVIDIGSNSVKMSVAHVTRESWSVIEEQKKSLRLLDDGEEKITPEKLKILVTTLSGFFKSIKSYDPLIRVYATSAVRRAKNRKAVLKLLRKKYGIHVNILSGIQEAHYVYHAVQSSFYINKGKFGIVDIGGGSMELIQQSNGKARWMKSISFGSVVVKDKFFDPQPKTDFDAIEKILHIQRQITKQIGGSFEGELIISGGTPSSIAKIFTPPKKFKQIHGKVLFMDELIELLVPLMEKPKTFWTNKHKINPSRVDLLLPCVCTVIALMRIAGQDHFQVSRTGLRRGIIEEAFQKIQFKK